VAQWIDIDWQASTISVRFKPEFRFKPKDYEERIVTISDSLLDCLSSYRGTAPDEAFDFPLARDKHDRQAPRPHHPPAYR
jgi:integrase